MKLQIEVVFSPTSSDKSMDEVFVHTCMQNLQSMLGMSGLVARQGRQVVVWNASELVNGPDGFVRDIYRCQTVGMAVVSFSAVLSSALLASDKDVSNSSESSYFAGNLSIVTGVFAPSGALQNFRTLVSAFPKKKEIILTHTCRPCECPEQNVNVFLTVLKQVMENAELTFKVKRLIEASRKSNQGMVGRAAKDLYQTIAGLLQKSNSENAPEKSLTLFLSSRRLQKNTKAKT